MVRSEASDENLPFLCPIIIREKLSPNCEGIGRILRSENGIPRIEEKAFETDSNSFNRVSIPRTESCSSFFPNTSKSCSYTFSFSKLHR